MAGGWIAGTMIGCLCALAGKAWAGAYPQIGGGPEHRGVAFAGAPADLSSPRFIAGSDLLWVWQAGVAVGGGRVVGLMEYADGGDWYMGVVAVDETDGQVLWTATVPDLVWLSWSSPSIDMAAGVVVVASGNQVTGLSLADGQELWHVLARPGKSFVNACPTTEPGVVYIPEFGGSAMLYAIDTTTGLLKWQAPAGYVSGANTVAVTSTRVVLAGSDGRFRTFDKQTGAADVNVMLTSGNGFFGGVAVEGGAAYTVSYAFSSRYGPTNLYKVNVADGAILWSVPAPRTDTIPVVASGMVLVSGGDDYQRMGDGTDNACLWAFDKTSGQFLWSTTAAGGWTCQPLYVDGTVFVPTLSSTEMGGVIYALDATRTPQDPAFVIGWTDRIACSIAAANGNIYGTGLYGLAAFGPAVAAPGDINGEGTVDVADVLRLGRAWGAVAGEPGYDAGSDLDGSGTVDAVDLLLLADAWSRVHGGP